MTEQEALDELRDLWDEINHHNVDTDCETFFTEKREEAYKMAESSLKSQIQYESTEKKYVTQKEFKPDYSKDCEVASEIQLDLAVEVFMKMIDEMGISFQDFLGELMYKYGLEPEDVYVAED